MLAVAHGMAVLSHAVGGPCHHELVLFRSVGRHRRGRRRRRRRRRRYHNHHNHHHHHHSHHNSRNHTSPTV
jgi:hypothetical protein